LTIGGVEFDLKITFVIIFGTIVPLLLRYGHRLTDTREYDNFLFYFVLPVLIILFLFRESPAEYGLTLGNWRAGLLWTGAVCAVMAVILWFVARSPDMQQYYNARTSQEVWRVIYLNGVSWVPVPPSFCRRFPLPLCTWANRSWKRSAPFLAAPGLVLLPGRPILSFIPG